MKISAQALREVEEALMKYMDEVEGIKQMSVLTKTTYITHAKNFVRWLADDFQPGSKVK